MSVSYPPQLRRCVVRVGDEQELVHVRTLMRAHAEMLKGLGVDIAAFQGFEAELAALPGKYGESYGGCLLLLTTPPHPAFDATVPGPVASLVADSVPVLHKAHADVAAAATVDPSFAAAAGVSSALLEMGCVAIHRLSPSVAEIKRLFVSPSFRGLRLGELLSRDVMRVARAMGYTHVCLDTLQRLPAAHALYVRLGFVPVPRYNDNPMHDIMFLGRPTVEDEGEAVV